MAMDLNLIGQLLGDYKKPEDIIGENGLLKQLTKAVLERALRRKQAHPWGTASTTRPGTTAGIRGTEQRGRS